VRLVLAGSSIAFLLWSAVAAQAAGPRVRGPASVAPGEVVAFHASGFREGSMVNVVLSPVGKPRCCAARLAASFLVSPAGGAVLRFRMPPFYLRCIEGGQCRKVRWRPHERVVVNVFGYLQQAATITSIEA
jgi:hypothetical protein